MSFRRSLRRRKLKTRDALLDGELVVLDKAGVSRFQLLQQLGSSRARLTYFAFDLLRLDGENLTREPLEDRKRAEISCARCGRYNRAKVLSLYH